MDEIKAGAAGKAALCAGCGALVPNTWCDPRGYVHVGGKVFCSLTCAAMTTPCMVRAWTVEEILAREG